MNLEKIVNALLVGALVFSICVAVSILLTTHFKPADRPEPIKTEVIICGWND